MFIGLGTVSKTYKVYKPSYTIANWVTTMKVEADDETYYEIYGEYVSLRELIKSTLICAFFAMLFFLIAPMFAGAVGIPPAGFSVTLGAIGAAIGFAISVFLVDVKRVVSEV